MKKITRLLVAIALSVGLIGAVSATAPLAETAAAATYVSTKYTHPKSGQTNAGVKALQQRLVKANVLSSKYVTGYYGQKTENGVKRFQTKYGLKRTGKVTASLWRLLVRKTGTIKLGESASSAKLTQRCKIDGRVLCIDKTRSKAYYVKNGKIIKTMDARFGCSGTATREGTFRVFRKNRHWTSTIYHSPMPFSMFFSGGQAVHYSSDFAARGYAGCSHGCVNIRKWSTIEYVFGKIRVGDRVVVYRS